jgi:hypothetical protein
MKHISFSRVSVYFLISLTLSNVAFATTFKGSASAVHAAQGFHPRADTPEAHRVRAANIQERADQAKALAAKESAAGRDHAAHRAEMQSEHLKGIADAHLKAAQAPAAHSSKRK